MTAGAVLKQLEEYNRHATRALKAQAGERQAMIAMLSQTILKIGGVNERTAGRLREIETRLEKASEIDDVRVLRVKMAECLENIREGRTAHQADADQLMDDARAQMLARGIEVPEVGPAADIPDAVTGLPDMRAAIREFGAPPEAGQQLFAVAFAANRLRAINARFGYAVGDVVLTAVKEQIAHRISASDRLFRWRGPCIVAILQRPGSLAAVRQEAARIGAFRLDNTIDIGNRTILLPISCIWSVIAPGESPREMASQVDAFVAAAEPPE
jgi:GGDEF domain-containing protein